MTSAQFSCLHFVCEGKVFAHIPAFESSTAEQRMARFDFSTVNLYRFQVVSMAFTNVTGKNNYRIERMHTSSTYPVSGDGNEVRPRPN